MLTPKTLSRVLSFILALLVIAAIALGVLLLQARASVGEHQAAPTDAGAAAEATDVAVETTPQTEEAQPATVTSTKAAPAPAVTTTVTQEQSPSSNSGSNSDSSMPAGMNSRGWNDNAATSCGSGESLVYAGRGGGNWVTVCSTGSTLTYRGDVFDGVLSAEVDRSASNASAAHFSIPASPHTIVIHEDELNVYDGGTVVSGASFSETYLAD